MSDSGIVTPHYGLYPYQRQVLADILSALSAPRRRAVAHLPTGAGKTRIASHAACHVLNEADSENALVIWLASTEELCEQAAEELSHAWQHLGRRDARVHRYWDDSSPDLRRLTCGFLVAGLAKLRSTAFHDHTLLAHLSICAEAVIFDEAHQVIAETYSFMTEQLVASQAALLGLTATPGRTWELTDEDHRLAEFFDHKKVSIDPKGHGNPVTFLINNGYLANPNFVPIRFESDMDVTEPGIGLDYSQHDLGALGRSDKRTVEIVNLSKKAAQRHPRTIVFCPSVRSALECGSLLQSQGVRTGVVTANTPAEERHALLDDFRSDGNDHMVLFNYGVLTAGFDAPRIRCAIIARPTTSLVLYSQMVGRAMRGPKAGGNRNAEILTVVDTNLPGFGSVTEAFTNWEELWSNNPQQ